MGQNPRLRWAYGSRRPFAGGFRKRQARGLTAYLKLPVWPGVLLLAVASDATFSHRMRLHSRGILVVSHGSAPGAAGLHLADGVPLLRPEEQVFEAMLDGWRNQQLARNLALSTIEKRAGRLQAFFAHSGAYPWEWLPQYADEWFGTFGRCAVSRTRRCGPTRMRCGRSALTSPTRCTTRRRSASSGSGLTRFRIVHEWNSAVHVQDNENRPEKRAFTLDELQGFFDYADEQVTRARDSGRKGWLPAFRDAVLFKVAYGYGLRRNETRMLDVTDAGRNPHAPEFGDYGLVHVRYGKARRARRPSGAAWRPSGRGRRKSWRSGSPSSGPTWLYPDRRLCGRRARGADRAPADQLAVRRLP